MEFSHVDSKIDSNTLEKAKAIFDAVLLDLGLRETNFFCGTGLGGDNFKLLVLYCFNHELTTSNCFYVDSGRRVRWGVDYLLTTSIKKIRLDLEDIFVNGFLDTEKYMALGMRSLIESQSFVHSYEEYKDEFTYVQRQIKRATLDSAFIANMNNLEKLILACSICVQCSKDLDAGKTALIDEYGIALNQFDKETVLLSVRKFIGITRIIRYNLDENKNWQPVLDRVNKAVSIAEGS